MFRISWKSAHSSGYGEYCLNEKNAKTWVDVLNKKYIGEIHHWMEKQQ